MPETTPLIKAALNLRGGAGFDVYRHGINMRDSSIYESKLKNNATNEQYTFIGLSIHECHKESLSNKIGITLLCNPLA